VEDHPVGPERVRRVTGGRVALGVEPVDDEHATDVALRERRVVEPDDERVAVHRRRDVRVALRRRPGVVRQSSLDDPAAPVAVRAQVGHAGAVEFGPGDPPGGAVLPEVQVQFAVGHRDVRAARVRPVGHLPVADGTDARGVRLRTAR
jgi:hypothetical protein